MMDDTFENRLKGVEQRIREACERADRNPEDVRIVAITKTFGPDAVEEAIQNGATIFGENRVQEAKQKIPLCSGRAVWHMVGHLQRNKARDAVQLFEMIHSVDSWRLLETLDLACATAGRRIEVCLEVNVSGESSKYGVAPDELPELLEKSQGLRDVHVTGLMTIPPFTEDPEGARDFFKRLRELRDACEADGNLSLPELSMGMSHDFEIAVEEGATWVRLGTILFGGRGGK